MDMAAILATRQQNGSQTVEGDARAQIREIAGVWQAFFQDCVHRDGIDHNKVYFVCEDFTYMSGVAYHDNDGSASISTSIIWGVQGYRMGRADEWHARKRGQRRKVVVPEMIMQQAGQASTFATGKRLREWGIWVPGKDHERSAWKHVALFLKQYQIGLASRA